MAHRWQDRVKETSTTTGTGAMLLGGPVAGFQVFSTAPMADGDTICYLIVNLDVPTEWEVGLGTFDITISPPKTEIIRTTIYARPFLFAGNFSAGTKHVSMVYPAEAIIAGEGLMGALARLTLPPGARLSWAVDDAPSSAEDLILLRHAAAILSQRNGTAGQKLRVYTTFTDASNARWIELDGDPLGDGVPGLFAKGVGTGAAPGCRVGTLEAGAIRFFTNNTARWFIDGSSGHLLPVANNTYDIGEPGAGKVKSLYVGTAIINSGIYATGSSAPTIASAGTIAPTVSITFVSGTTTINTITPPATLSGGGQITLIPTGLWVTGVTGNIVMETVAALNRALIMTYDVTTAKWYPSY